MKDIRQKLLAVFQVEHQDHLSRIRALLANPDGSAGRPGPELDEAFRAAHSLKGAARAVDLEGIETLSHRLETLFARIRSGHLVLTPEVAQVIHRVLDQTEDILSASGDETRTAEYEAVLATIEEVLQGKKPAEPVPEAEPVLPPAEEKRETPGASPVFRPVESLRVEARHLDQLLSSAGRLLEENHQQEALGRELDSLLEEVLALEKHWSPLRRRLLKAARREGQEEETPGRLENRLFQLDQKLRSVSGHSRQLRNLQKKNSWGLRRLSEDLRDDLRRARMIPAGTVFEGFQKMVRDLARDEKKDIRLVMSGLDCEADRLVLQALKDPLMHILRNAIGHAIESPDERLAGGKERGGTIALSVESIGGMLKIRVADDGRGMDLKKIARTAVERGLIGENAAADASGEELYRFIFLPGFSTASEVTSLSGRGMGLSVVAEELARLQGGVSVRPGMGGGLEFNMAVPLSLSTHHLLLVQWKGQALAIPSHAVVKVGQVREGEIELFEERPRVRLAGAPVELVSLAQLLEKNGEGPRVAGGKIALVFLKSGGKKLAVAVDAFLGQLDGLVRDLGFYFKNNRSFAGGLIQGDGSVALVLNPAHLMETVRGVKAAPPLKEEPAAEIKKDGGSILVVDDSITTRTLEKSILEASGYRVTLAVDGTEALAVLRNLHPDLIISDVQMPKMDGFGLLEKLKENDRLKHIPVILLTSLENREDQERGMALGADAYVVKGKFDQRNLLETIRQIL